MNLNFYSQMNNLQHKHQHLVNVFFYLLAVFFISTFLWLKLLKFIWFSFILLIGTSMSFWENTLSGKNCKCTSFKKILCKAGSAPLKRTHAGMATLSSVQLCLSCLRTLLSHLPLGHFWELSQNIPKRDDFPLKPAELKKTKTAY